MKQAMRSNWPSQMMARWASSRARLDLSRPNMTLPLVKMGVSGELTYLAVFSSPVRTRPLKADDAALFVADGKDEAAAKAVVEMVRAFLARDQAGLLDQRQFEMFAFGPIDRVVPGVGRVAEAEEFDGLGGDAAAGEVIAGDLAGALAGQGGLPALGDLLVDLKQAGP